MTATSPICPQCGGQLPPGRTAGLCPKCLLMQGLESHPATLAPTESSGRDSGLPSFVAPTPAELGPLFPQLEILELLGVGGMGAVYKARQASLGRMVALKILPPEVGRDASFAERFMREAQALAQLNHAHIVTIHDVNQTATGGLYYILMEYVDGTNLRQMMQSGALAPQQALALVPQLCDALQYAHDEGIVHRDIKPENILVDKRGRAKIADFGLAKMLGDRVLNTSLTGTQQVMGTLRYMAPEQMLGARDVDHRADIYALGVVFYELLTGDLPMGRFPLPSEKAHCDARLDEVVLRALERERDRRYQQAKEIKTDVEQISSSYRANGKTPPAAPLKSPQPIPAPRHAASPDEEFENAADDVRPAANAMIALGVLQVLVAAGTIGVAVVGEMVDHNPGPTDLYPGLIIAGIAHLLLPLILIPAGLQMRAMRSHEFAQIAAGIALLPLQFSCFLTAPIGLWALMVLMRSNVRAAFRTPTRQRPEAWRMSDAEVLAQRDSADPAFQRAMQRTSGKVKAVAIGQIVVGILDVLGGILLPMALMNSNPMNAAPIGVLLVLSVVPLLAGTIVLAGAVPMLRLRFYPLAVASAICSIVPLAPLWPIRTPIGIWALVTLVRRDVRAAFEAWRRERQRPATGFGASHPSIVEKAPPIPARVYDLPPDAPE